MATTDVVPAPITPAQSPTLACYPTSPIAHFPPPVQAAVRRPLRERCGFNLSLKIHTTCAQQGRAAPWSPKGHVQPHRNNLPRRRKGQIKRIVVVDDDSPSTTEPKPDSEQPPKGERHLQEVVPGLFLAFKLADAAADAAKRQEERYTHVIDICYPPPGYDSGAIEQAYEGRVHRLRLVLPAAHPADAERAGLGLTDAQLRAARDFLAQALPYVSATAPPPLMSSAPCANVRILVSTPPRRPTDAMSIVGCYLSFVSNKGADATLRFIDDQADILSIWKWEVSEDEVGKIERVARMWSWLSKVRR